MFSQVEAKDPAHLSVLKQRVSADRLSPYLSEVGGRLAEAFDLYNWNIQVSSAMSADLERMEVVLRGSRFARLGQVS